MFGSVKLHIKEFNDVITCSICHGYLIDATSLSDCHHSFCRSCILKHVLSSNLCPVCGLLIHKTRPELNLIADQNLQQIVYKLVPGLLKDELRRREEHYSKSENNEKAEDSLRTDYSDKIEVDNTKVCIVINILKALQIDGGKCSFVNKTKKFLLCPGLFTVKLLKKFVHDKCELEKAENVEVIHLSDDEFLPDHYTLLDVANIYSWKPDSHLELKCVIWNDSIFSTDQSCDIRADTDNDDCSHSTEYPFQSFKEFCRHLRRTSMLCPFISPKKRHKNNRNKPTLKDVTNVSKPSPTTHKANKTIAQHNIDTNASSSHTVSDSFETPQTNLAPCQAGCKLKLRIRAKGIEDSILILPSAPDSSNKVKDQVIEANSECCHIQEKPYFSVRQILEGQNDKSIKKFMSKKDLFFSRLGLEGSAMPNFCEKIPEPKFKDNEPITDVSKNEMTNALNPYQTHEPLNISIDRPNILTTTQNSNVHNFKKRLLLTTVPVRARGQLWTPYKSPLKEFAGEIPHNSANASSPETKRSKSPVIVFNPALPLPSFTSLLQSFDSKRSADPLSSSDSSTAINCHQSQITPNSKIGVFISKGKSMTLEQKTKLQGDNNSIDGVSCTGHFPDESSINKSWEELQDLFPRKAEMNNESSLGEVEKKRDEDKESDHLQNSHRCDEESVAKSHLKWHAKSSKITTGKQKTPPWLGKRVQLKKSPITSIQSPKKSNEDEKSTNDDDLKSPLKKKALVDDQKSENVSNDELPSKNDKGFLSSRICNISKRALKTIN